ncbi:hypothetical protein [Massilia cavernae]|uniref:ArsR family transcriptional regulator n=1 Tax=Massilia cavernae TaxID=2320864 RepID=A0A418XGM8_9BURK|nr:hypothetical protein [Massilia cavernae]RJG11620.1 hypothetical protein D3872_18830 [Massilia cavernae]
MNTAGARDDVPAPGMLPSIARRLELTRVLIESLAGGTIYLNEIAELFGCASSVAKHRVKHLRRIGILEVASDIGRAAGRRREHPYRLCEPFRRTPGDLMRSAGVWPHEIPLVQRRRLAQLSAGGAGAGYYFHVPAHEVQAAIRSDRRPVRRDSLVAALFGGYSGLS